MKNVAEKISKTRLGDNHLQEEKENIIWPVWDWIIICAIGVDDIFDG